MSAYLPLVYSYLSGCATVAAWWFWIGHKAKVRAAEQAALAAAKKVTGP